MAKEKRRYPRFECKGPATIQVTADAAPTPAKIVNLSAEGCLIELQKPERLSQDTVVELTFNVNDLPFRVWGRVKAIRSSTAVGFEFPLMSDRVKDRLAILIEQLIEDFVTKGLLGGAREKRRYPRIPCSGSASVHLTSGEDSVEASYPSSIVNLSMGGCLVVLHKPQKLAEDTNVELSFQVNHLPFRVRGKVRAIRSESKIGLQFLQVSERVRKQLEDLVDELFKEVIKRFKERQETD